jgi:hypothetical protein
VWWWVGIYKDLHGIFFSKQHFMDSSALTATYHGEMKAFYSQSVSRWMDADLFVFEQVAISSFVEYGMAHSSRLKD